MNYLTYGEVFMHAMRPTKANLIFKTFYFTSNYQKTNVIVATQLREQSLVNFDVLKEE